METKPFEEEAQELFTRLEMGNCLNCEQNIYDDDPLRVIREYMEERFKEE